MGAESTVTECQQCEDGTVAGTGSASCVPLECPPGRFVQGNTCAPCVVNDSGACEEIVCPAGQFVDDRAADLDFDGSPCVPCPAESFQPDEGPARGCDLCPLGQTTDGEEGAATCIPVTCPAGSFVSGNPPKCSECPEGFTSEGGTATECTPIVIKGCTNPAATNYDSNATEDDGTCIFLNVAKAGGGSKVSSIGPHSQVTSGNGAFGLRNRNSGTDLSISNSATWASSGLFGKAAGDSGAEAM